MEATVSSPFDDRSMRRVFMCLSPSSESESSFLRFLGDVAPGSSWQYFDVRYLRGNGGGGKCAILKRGRGGNSMYNEIIITSRYNKQVVSLFTCSRDL